MMNGVKENRGVLSITDFTKRQPPFFIRTFGKSLYHGTPYREKNYSVKTFDFHLFNAFHVGDQFI